MEDEKVYYPVAAVLPYLPRENIQTRLHLIHLMRPPYRAL